MYGRAPTNPTVPVSDCAAAAAPARNEPAAGSNVIAAAFGGSPARSGPPTLSTANVISGWPADQRSNVDAELRRHLRVHDDQVGRSRQQLLDLCIRVADRNQRLGPDLQLTGRLLEAVGDLGGDGVAVGADADQGNAWRISGQQHRRAARAATEDDDEQPHECAQSPPRGAQQPVLLGDPFAFGRRAVLAGGDRTVEVGALGRGESHRRLVGPRGMGSEPGTGEQVVGVAPRLLPLGDRGEQCRVPVEVLARLIDPAPQPVPLGQQRLVRHLDGRTADTRSRSSVSSR